MLYKIFLFPAKWFIHLYCKRVSINNKSLLQQKGPLLLAANHPNSFLDAIILGTLFKNPVYSLARGDAFVNKLVTRVLKSFNMLPVYRVSEGVENLESNYETFDACQEIFKQDGIVLIFSEGKCTNEWHLRPLKKGTARLALEAWRRGVDLKVLPVGINYSSFKNFGKTVAINFGNIIAAEEINNQFYSGKEINEFNHKLRQELQELVFEIDQNDSQKKREQFFEPISNLKKAILFPPGMIGFLFHFPLFLLIHFLIIRKADVHYDSVMTGLLFFVYPLFVLSISLLAGYLGGASFFVLAIVGQPFCLWSFVQLRGQL
ncbi:MAG: 1-acyl-sn-glycerol-3-phosphate acyltransferase [Ginsengibacter sp.]